MRTNNVVLDFSEKSQSDNRIEQLSNYVDVLGKKSFNFHK